MSGSQRETIKSCNRKSSTELIRLDCIPLLYPSAVYGKEDSSVCFCRRRLINQSFICVLLILLFEFRLRCRGFSHQGSVYESVNLQETFLSHRLLIAGRAWKTSTACNKTTRFISSVQLSSVQFVVVCKQMIHIYMYLYLCIYGFALI